MVKKNNQPRWLQKGNTATLDLSRQPFPFTQIKNKRLRTIVGAQVARPIEWAGCFCKSLAIDNGWPASLLVRRHGMAAVNTILL